MTILGECAASSAPAAGRRRRVSVCQNSTPVSFSRHQSPLLLHGRGARLGARSCGLNLALRKSRTGNLKQWGSPRRQHPGPLHRAPPPRHSWRYHPLSWDNGLRHPHPSGPARSGPSDAHFLCDPGQGRARHLLTISKHATVGSVGRAYAGGPDGASVGRALTAFRPLVTGGPGGLGGGTGRQFLH